MHHESGSFRSRITNETHPFVDAVHEKLWHVYLVVFATVVVHRVLAFPTFVGGGQVATDVAARRLNFERQPMTRLLLTRGRSCRAHGCC